MDILLTLFKHISLAMNSKWLWKLFFFFLYFYKYQLLLATIWNWKLMVSLYLSNFISFQPNDRQTPLLIIAMVFLDIFFFLSCSSATCSPTKCFLCTRNTTWQTVSLFWQHSDTALCLKFCINKEINLPIIKLSRLSYSGLSLVKTVSGRESMFLVWGEKKLSTFNLKK